MRPAKGFDMLSRDVAKFPMTGICRAWHDKDWDGPAALLSVGTDAAHLLISAKLSFAHFLSATSVATGTQLWDSTTWAQVSLLLKACPWPSAACVWKGLGEARCTTEMGAHQQKGQFGHRKGGTWISECLHWPNAVPAGVSWKKKEKKKGNMAFLFVSSSPNYWSLTFWLHFEVLLV